MTPLALANGAVDVAGLRDELAGAVSGEARFDRLSRALYSTDASVYQIVPLGVILPKTAGDILATLRACERFRIPLTARGGGTSQAGQAIGPGVVLDCSKHFNRILEINAAEAWARVEPGCVLDELNLHLQPHGLHFAPDISTSNRATIGGMIANNSSGTHSIIHGKTGDHVLELKVTLADGSVLNIRPLNDLELDAKCGQRNREGDCYRTVLRLAGEHAGEIDRRYPKILRRVGGYDLTPFAHDHQSGFNLTPLLVGSEGTLAVTLEAKLRLLRLPRAKALLVVQFTSLLDALAAAPGVLTHGPSALEVIDRYVLDSTKLNPDASRLRDFLHGDPGAILIIEFYGDNAAELPSRLDALEADLKRHDRGNHYVRATDSAAQARIWKLRKLALGLSMAEKGDAKAISFVEDTAVDPKHLHDYIAEFLEIIRRHGATAGVYAHASVGCLHVRPVINLKTAAGVGQFEAIAADVASLVLKYGGALSGEHGDGLVRTPFQEKMYGPALYQAFREIKHAFDPLGLLNPGKIVDAPPLATNFRFGATYVTPDVPTTFDFSADGGIVRAAELCAGVGECRKQRDGSMCPSYRATCDEQHSTRGRANTLRLAMTGQLGLEGFTDPAVKEALDLCLECKACKSECPTNVDMARLKAEFLHQYYKKHGLPWRNWIFGHVGSFSRFGSRRPRILNWMLGARAIRWLNEKLFGIDRRRVPPRRATWDRQFLGRFLASQLPEGVNDLPRTALLFPDTFIKFYEPHIGAAACDLLHDSGLRLRTGFLEGWEESLGPPEDDMSGVRCCGRPLISNGLLAEAARHAENNVECLYSWAAAGRPIVACEPSCILTIKDDYPALVRGDLRRKAKVVSAACHTFDEFLDSTLSGNGSRNAEDSILSTPYSVPSPPQFALCPAPRAPRPFSFRPGPKRILVHPHCHERSLVGVEPTLRLLRRIPGAEVIDLDAGCCGMAGSFGYEKEHYEISRQIGELKLFPAVRAADADTVIVASGFSCRQQIEHFTGRKALHPAELLAGLLESAPTSE